MEVKEIKPPWPFVKKFLPQKKYSLHHIYQGIAKNYFYHRFRWYATLENKTPAETFPISGSLVCIPVCILTYRLYVFMYTQDWRKFQLETFPRVFCFSKVAYQRKQWQTKESGPFALMTHGSCIQVAWRIASENRAKASKAKARFV